MNEQEIRGTRVWVWTSNMVRTRFAPIIPDTTGEVISRHEVIAPIGWTFQPHPMMGVTLTSVFGERLEASEALARFRAIKTEHWLP